MSAVHRLVSVLFHRIFTGVPTKKFSLPFGILTCTTGGTQSSSLLIVTTPWLSVTTAWVGLNKFTKNVSCGSHAISPFTEIVSVALVCLSGNVTVPLAA